MVPFVWRCNLWTLNSSVNTVKRSSIPRDSHALITVVNLLVEQAPGANVRQHVGKMKNNNWPLHSMNAVGAFIHALRNASKQSSRREI